MGVAGIWDHMQKYAEYVDISEMKNTVLAIDGHIWLYESAKGCQAHGVSNASYLVTFYNRCRRLREHGIEPIIVFDSVIYDPQGVSDLVENLIDNVCRKRSKRSGGNGWNAAVSAELGQRIAKVQTLLSQMGVPCLWAASDGEAQCAQLEQAGVTNGCITTDFDYFLFGGLNLYKLEFLNGGRSINPRVTRFSMNAFTRAMSLNRNRLVALAMLLGCDYLEGGVGGVGMITALEILSEFTVHEDDHTLSILDRFASYCKQELPERESDSQVKLKFRSNKFKIPYGFPNTAEYCEAASIYLIPNVIEFNRSTVPLPREMNNRAVAGILMKECSWSVAKFNKELSRSQKKENAVRNYVIQTRIFDYFPSSRRRSITEPVFVPCVDEDRRKCSQREWAAIEKLKRRSCLYDHIMPMAPQKRLGPPIVSNGSPAKRGSAIVISDQTTPTTSTQQQNLQACEDGETFSVGPSIILLH